MVRKTVLLDQDIPLSGKEPFSGERSVVQLYFSHFPRYIHQMGDLDRVWIDWPKINKGDRIHISISTGEIVEEGNEKMNWFKFLKCLLFHSKHYQIRFNPTVILCTKCLIHPKVMLEHHLFKGYRP